MIDWPFDVRALAAPVVNLNQLRENSSSLGDHASDLNQGVQMNLSKVSQLVLHWQILDSDENFGEGIVVVGIDLAD